MDLFPESCCFEHFLSLESKMSYEVEKRNLAIEVIDAHFGQDLAGFCAKLIDKVLPWTVRELISEQPLNRDIIIANIGILFQHNLLLIHEGADEESRMEFSPMRAALRLLFPAFLCLFREKFGQLGEEIATIFVEQGRMSQIALRAQISAKYREDDSDKKRAIFNVFQEITSQDFPLLSPCMSLHVLSAEGNSLIVKSEHHDNRDFIPEPKRKRGEIDASSVELVYAINIPRLLHEIQKKEIMQYVSRCFVDEWVPKVIRHFVEKDSSLWNYKETAFTFLPKRTSSVAMAAEAFMTQDLCKSVSQVESILQSLSSGVHCDFVTCSNGSTVEKTVYQLDYTKLVSVIREETLEAYIRQRYGSDGLRIFRLLLRHQFAEEMTISDECKIAPEIVRSCLFDLQKMGCTQSQCVSASPKDIYLWSVNSAQALEHIAVGALKTIRILFARMHKGAQQCDSQSPSGVNRSLGHSISEIILQWFRVDIL